tara:strand:- start:459 stop:854 length:396 start_codon:yes stop_codon:yes gene_type:complete
MKQLLLMLLVMVSGTVFGQYTTTKIQTNTVSTSKMIYNYQEEKWDFISNNDQTAFVTEWTFNITDYNTGMISNGTVNYDILEYKKVDDAAYVKVYNTKVGRNMDIVIRLVEGGLGIVVFDKTNRTGFYFFP